jgi:hypothetical protein
MQVTFLGKFRTETQQQAAEEANKAALAECHKRMKNYIK